MKENKLADLSMNFSVRIVELVKELKECLDRNTPSIEFYRAMGAVPMSDWTVYRVTGNALKKLAE